MVRDCCLRSAVFAVVVCACLVWAEHTDGQLAGYALMSLPDGYRLIGLDSVKRVDVAKFYRVKIKVQGVNDEGELECDVKMLERRFNDLTIESSKCE